MEIISDHHMTINIFHKTHKINQLIIHQKNLNNWKKKEIYCLINTRNYIMERMESDHFMSYKMIQIQINLLVGILLKKVY
jgi:hypothetical protein